MGDQAWTDFANHVERQLEAIQTISGNLAEIVLQASTIERKAIMQSTLEHYRQETEYFARLLAEIKRGTLAA